MYLIVSYPEIIHTFISSRIDYYNSLLCGLPSFDLDNIQRIQNTATAASNFLLFKYDYQYSNFNEDLFISSFTSLDLSFCLNKDEI